MLRVASTRPDLIRSWVSDVAGLLDPDYVWHDFAQVWQTPGAGEQWVADTLAQPRGGRASSSCRRSASRRTPPPTFVDAFDQEMGRCMLALYRSAAQPAMHEWGRDVGRASARPGW